MDNEVEVLRIIRVPPMGKLVAQIGRKRYENLNEITDQAAQQRVKAAIGEMVGFCGGYQQLVDAGLAPPVIASTEAASQQSLAEQQEQFLQSLSGGTNPPQAVDPLRSVPASDPANALSPPASENAALDIAGQINELIEKHKAQNPQFANRTVKLLADASGEMRIQVDGKTYEKPSQIEEKDVRALVKFALKEWERK